MCGLFVWSAITLAGVASMGRNVVQAQLQSASNQCRDYESRIVVARGGWWMVELDRCGRQSVARLKLGDIAVGAALLLRAISSPLSVPKLRDKKRWIGGVQRPSKVGNETENDRRR